MKRLLALLLMLASPVFAQEIVPGPYLPTPPVQIDAQTGNIVYTTLNPPPPGTNFTWTGFINTSSSGGGLQGGNIPGYNPSTGTFLFGYAQGTVKYRLFDSPDWPSDGTMFNGFKYSWEYFNQEFSRGTISGNIKVLGVNNSILENYNFSMPQTTEGWTLMSGQIDFNTPYNIADISGFELSFTGKDDRFWAGYYGPQVRDIEINALYTIPPPPIPTFLYWNTLAGEWGTFTLTETTTVRYGAQGTYIYATLQPGTYECTNGAWGMDPIGGVVKSCEAGTNTAVVDVPDLADCTINPTDPNCSIATYTDPTLIANDIADDASDAAIADGTDTNFGSSSTSMDTVDGSTPEEELFAVVEEEQSSTDEDVTDDEALEEMLAADETSEEVVKEEAAVASAAEAEKQENEEKLADAIDPSILNLVLSIVESTSVVDNSGATAGASSATATTAIAADSNNSGATVASTASRVDAAAAIAEVAAQIAVENAVELLNNTAQSGGAESDSSGFIDAQGNDSLNADIEFMRQVNEAVATNQTTESAFDDKTDLDVPVLSFDPNNPLSQFVNNMPSIANQEAAGVLNNRQDKSDAEVRAEQVVAANKEEQDAINANYMDADQSGIVVAMGSDIDFTSYRSVALQDANLWYMPEDIYKNIVLKDNVRGSYFLEKGSTDTYKKMVEEQYK